MNHKARKISPIMAIILLSCLLLGCGKEERTAPKYAGLYTCLGYYADKQFIVVDELKNWSVTLDKDGTGRLYWGEDNNGPISHWTVEDNTLTIEAGISVIKGAVSEGVMLLNMGDGVVLGWASSQADFSKLHFTTMDILAAMDADTSHIETISIAEYNALPAEKKNG